MSNIPVGPHFKIRNQVQAMRRWVEVLVLVMALMEVEVVEKWKGGRCWLQQELMA